VVARGLIGDQQVVGQRRLVAEQDAELEQGGVSAAHLGQADELATLQDDLVG